MGTPDLDASVRILPAAWTVEAALSQFLQAHDDACAQWGLKNAQEGSAEAESAAFTVLAQVAGVLGMTILDAPGDPLREAMASAVSLYQQAAVWGSLTTREPSATWTESASQTTGRMFMRTSGHAIERWTEWAPRFFELVGLPDVPAPNLMPTYDDSETVPA